MFPNVYVLGCSREIPAITNKKYCDECTKKRKPSTKTQESKKLMIKEMIEMYISNNISNTEIEKKLNYYNKLITEKGHSKDLEKLSKIKELEPLYLKLKNGQY